MDGGSNEYKQVVPKVKERIISKERAPGNTTTEIKESFHEWSEPTDQRAEGLLR